MEENKKNNIIKLFIKVLLLFIIVDSIIGILPSLLAQIISYSKYTISIIAETLALILILIIIKIRDKTYIFNKSKENLFKTLYIGFPMFLLSITLLLVNSISIIKDGINLYNIISLIFYCAAIGCFEEFLCRGWLLNEFLSKYGKNRRQVITSIILSSIVFGLMHISNIWNAGQSVFETILQVINAISMGAFLGAVYYRTKNIFGVAFLHGFYDYTILLAETNVLKECTTGIATNRVLLYQTIATMAIVIIFILCTIIILRKTKLNPLLEEKEELTPKDIEKDKNLKIYLIIACILLNFTPLPNVSEEELNNYDVCYDYGSIEIPNYNINISNYEEYNIDYTITKEIPVQEQINEESIETINDPTPIEEISTEETYYNYKVYLNKDNKVIIENTNTKDYIILKYEDVLNLNVIKNNNEVIILIQTYENTNSILYYNKFITEDTLSNSIDYLNNISNTFNSIVTPDSNTLGSLSTREDDYIYPFIITIDGDYMVLDKDNNLLLVK